MVYVSTVLAAYHNPYGYENIMLCSRILMLKVSRVLTFKTGSLWKTLALLLNESESARG